MILLKFKAVFLCGENGPKTTVEFSLGGETRDEAIFNAGMYCLNFVNKKESLSYLKSLEILEPEDAQQQP